MNDILEKADQGFRAGQAVHKVGEPQVRDGKIEQIEKQETIERSPRCLPTHPASRRLDPYPTTNDGDLAEDKQDGIDCEFDDTDDERNPEITVFFELVKAIEAVPERRPVGRYHRALSLRIM